MPPDSRVRRHVLSSLLAAPLLAAAPMVNSRDRGIAGQSAPELDVEFWLDAQGDKGHFSIIDNRGKWIYLKCWQSWCPGCHSSGFPTLKKITDAFANEPLLAIAGIQTTFEGHDVNTGDKVREMQLRYELSIPMGHDPGMRNADGYPNTMRAYRTGGTPWQVLINPEGQVVFEGFHVDPDKAIEFLQIRIKVMKTA